MDDLKSPKNETMQQGEFKMLCMYELYFSLIHVSGVDSVGTWDIRGLPLLAAANGRRLS